MRTTDIISFFALFLSIFATIFSAIVFVKELQIEDHIAHLHKHNLNITSIVRLDKDIAHLFRTLGMEANRADRLRHLLQINANATAKRRRQSRLSNSTEGKRGPTKSNREIFQGNATTRLSTSPTGKTFIASKGKDK